CDRRFSPELDPAPKGVTIRPPPHIFREFLQLLRVSASEHDVIGDKRIMQVCDGRVHGGLPLFESDIFQVLFPEDFFERPVLGKTQPAQLEWDDYFIENQGRSQTGAQPKEKHPAASITAQR